MSGNKVLIEARGVTVRYGKTVACRDVSLDLRAGEVLGIVGESGSGKTSLLTCLSGRLRPSAGEVLFDMAGKGLTDVYALSEPERRRLRREEWGVVHQTPRDGLRLRSSRVKIARIRRVPIEPGNIVYRRENGLSPIGERQQ